MMEQSELYIDNAGDKFWYLPSKGKYYWHRIDSPAIECVNGAKYWWTNGERHRIDGAAGEAEDGTKVWFVNGKRHRTDGPAIEDADGTKVWFVNGKRHRTDGPAIEYANGSQEWWINNIDITKKVEEWIEQFGIDMNTDEGKMRFKLVWS